MITLWFPSHLILFSSSKHCPALCAEGCTSAPVQRLWRWRNPHNWSMWSETSAWDVAHRKLTSYATVICLAHWKYFENFEKQLACIQWLTNHFSKSKIIDPDPDPSGCCGLVDPWEWEEKPPIWDCQNRGKCSKCSMCVVVSRFI